MTYYNENDPKAAAWLRELIKAGLISKGEVDERSIVDVRGSDLARYTRCHFFAGIGGWDYALQLAGWPEAEPVWTGSCPCQPFSQAGKGKGESDERHLWPDFRRLIEECSPATVFGEQVASKAGRGWLNGVRVDLEAMDYEVGAADLCSPGVGAPHIRQRIYWVAQPEHPIGQPEHPIGRPEHPIGRPEHPIGRPEHQEHIKAYGRIGSGGSSEFRRMGDADDARSQGRRIDTGEYADQRATGATGSISGLGESDSKRLRGSGTTARPDDDGHASERIEGYGTPQRVHKDSACGMAFTDGGSGGNGRVQRRGEHGQQPTNGRTGFWDAFDIVHCTDGKARRIEPGSFPLAHGIPARMGRLRGYGNAINPYLTAEFIIACYEAAA